MYVIGITRTAAHMRPRPSTRRNMCAQCLSFAPTASNDRAC